MSRNKQLVAGYTECVYNAKACIDKATWSRQRVPPIFPLHEWYFMWMQHAQQWANAARAWESKASNHRAFLRQLYGWRD